MADFDRDTELEEGGAEPVRPELTTDDSDYWDLDDWGDDE